MIDSTALHETVHRAKVIVCVGPGGVGKTSCSAAIGIHAARQGRRVAVLTIDPARRLANALGLPSIGNEEKDIPRSAFEQVGLEPPKGRISAMMLDIKTAWDRVVQNYHPNPTERDRLLNNKFYRSLSTSLAGSQEYMAMEKLYELVHRKEDPLDLVVLDTPPAASAVDFLDAPSKMLGALDNDATRWVLSSSTSSRGIGRLVGISTSLFSRTIGKFTGTEVLDELSVMLQGFSGMYEGFRERARAVSEILGDPRTIFLVVSAPKAGPLRDAEQFARNLMSRQLTIGAFLLNRATYDPFTNPNSELDSAELIEKLQSLGGSDALASLLEREAKFRQSQASREIELVHKLSRSFSGLQTSLVPEFPGDIHDLIGLNLMENKLFSSSRNSNLS